MTEGRMALADRLGEIAGRCSREDDRETIIKSAAALRLPPVMEGMREDAQSVFAALTNIADAYDDREDDAFQIFKDCDQEPIRLLTLGICRQARSARAALSGPHPQARGEERAECAKIRHKGIFIERQSQGDGCHLFICHTGILKFLPDLYPTQAAAIAAVDAALAPARPSEATAGRDEALIRALRRLSIVQTHQMAYGGGTVHVGYTCKTCGSDWNRDQSEQHAPDCCAALTLPASRKPITREQFEDINRRST